jgi:hypothetical protein
MAGSGKRLMTRVRLVIATVNIIVMHFFFGILSLLSIGGLKIYLFSF